MENSRLESLESALRREMDAAHAGTSFAGICAHKVEYQASTRDGFVLTLRYVNSGCYEVSPALADKLRDQCRPKRVEELLEHANVIITMHNVDASDESRKLYSNILMQVAQHESCKRAEILQFPQRR